MAGAQVVHETEHELIVLRALCLTVVLLVGTVVLENLVGILRDTNLFGRQLIVQRLSEVRNIDFQLFVFYKLLYLYRLFELDVETGRRAGVGQQRGGESARRRR